jgi:hypothetical protein
MSENIDLRDGFDEELAILVSNNDKLNNLRSKPNDLMAVLVEEYLFTWWQVRSLIDELDLGRME